MRVAVIGAGFGSQHLEWLDGCPEIDVTVLGYHRNRRRAEELASRLRIPRITSDCADLVRTGDLDGLVIASPPDTHEKLAIPALERGLAVVCDKPLAHVVVAAESLAKAARERAARTMVIFQWRENQAFQYVRSQLAGGLAGELQMVDIVFHHDFLAGEATSWPWRHRSGAAGAGALGDLGVHGFDLLRWATGREWFVTGAQTRVAQPRRHLGDQVIECDTDDIAAVHLAAAEGTALARILVSRVSHQSQRFEVMAIGSRAVVRAVANPSDGSAI